MLKRIDDRLIAALVVAGGLATIAVVAYRLRDTYVGDAAVYLPYARNAGDLRFFQFNPGEFSSGSTSPLWSVLLGIPYLFGFGLMGAKAFAALSAAVGFVALTWAGRRLLGSWGAGAAAALLTLGTMVLFATALYESGLVVTTAALALLVGHHAVSRWDEVGANARTVAPLALAWAALAVSRPDCVILIGIQALALVVAERARVKPLLIALALAAIPAALYYGYSIAELGTYSTSSQGRSHALRESVEKWVGPLYFDTRTLRQFVSTPWVFAVVPAIVGWVLAARDRAHRWLAIYAVLTVGAYLALLTFVTPGFYDASRYLVPLIPAVALGACRAFVALQARLGHPALVSVAAALLLGIPALVHVRDYQTFVLTSGVTEHEVLERDAAAVINSQAKPGDSVLVYEVQARYSIRPDVHVLSEDGITDGKVAPYQESRDMTAFLKRYRPAWWIAHRSVTQRGFADGSVLERAFNALSDAPEGAARTFDGIRFHVVKRRGRPLAPRFGGWIAILRMEYPG